MPGLVLGVACGPRPGRARGFGLADPARGLPATDTTLFRIASITKVFTGLAVMRLRDEGRVDLDDPVREHLPWFRLRNSDTLPPVTIRHLLTHTSGLPTYSAATDFDRWASPDAGRLREALPTQSLVSAPGSGFKYSNLGFAVLGQLVEAASGLPYGRYLEERILSSLGMRRTVAHPAPDVPMARGHHLRTPGRSRRPADFLHLAAFTPAGGMATTADDMLRFLSFLLDPAPTSPQRDVLEGETLREMWEVHHWVDTARGGSGLAWGVEKRPGTHVAYHGGGLPTQTSHLRVDLEAGLGAIVLANAEDADPATYAREALALLRLAADAGSAGRGEDGPAAGGGGRADTSPRDPSGISPSGADGLRQYTGRYRFEERELWVVTLAGRLALIDPMQDRPSTSVMWLVPVGSHRFRVERGWPEGETAELVVDRESGDVMQLRLPALSYRRIGDVAGPEGGSSQGIGRRSSNRPR